MKSKFGMPSLIEFKSIEENAELCRKLGLDFIELNMDLPYCLPWKNEPSALKRLKEKYKVEFTIHFPEEIDFATFLSNIRQANTQLFNDMAHWASKAKIGLINMHLSLGTYFSLPGGKSYIYKKYDKEYKANLLDSFEKISKTAHEYGIKLCVENTKMPDYIANTFKDLSKMNNVFFTWDVGHDAKDGYKAKGLFSKFPDKISHMHFHDSDGKDDHLVLLKGTVDLMDRLQFANDKGIGIVIEQKTSEALIESVNVLKNKLIKHSDDFSYSLV